MGGLIEAPFAWACARTYNKQIAMHALDTKSEGESVLVYENIVNTIKLQRGRLRKVRASYTLLMLFQVISSARASRSSKAFCLRLKKKILKKNGNTRDSNP